MVTFEPSTTPASQQHDHQQIGDLPVDISAVQTTPPPPKLPQSPQETPIQHAHLVPSPESPTEELIDHQFKIGESSNSKSMVQQITPPTPQPKPPASKLPPEITAKQTYKQGPKSVFQLPAAPEEIINTKVNPKVNKFSRVVGRNKPSDDSMLAKKLYKQI
jgi:hypothetical protein